MCKSIKKKSSSEKKKEKPLEYKPWIWCVFPSEVNHSDVVFTAAQHQQDDSIPLVLHIYAN